MLKRNRHLNSKEQTLISFIIIVYSFKKLLILFIYSIIIYSFVIMALGINQVTYSNRKFCRSVGPGFATLGTSR